MKKLYRSNKNKMIAGVLGGLSEYFAIDANFIRLGFIFFLIITGVLPAVLVYLIAMYMVPENPVV